MTKAVTISMQDMLLGVKIPVIYQDEYLVVVSKPAGLLVHRTALDRHENEFLLQRLRQQLGVHLFPVHRLDKPTSGLIIFALSSTMAHALQIQIQEHSLEKIYWLVCRGFTATKGEVDHPLGLTPDDKRKGKGGAADQPKDALTAYRLLQHYSIPHCVEKYPTTRYSLVEVSPATGRKHQIRRHFKHLSHPIIGDPKYGKSIHNRYIAELTGVSRLMLHAQCLRFTHPHTQQPVVCSVEPDNDFTSVLQKLALFKA